MRVLVIGDTHIDDPYLDELRDIFEEIMSYDADHVIHLGDYYNHHKPSPQSLTFGTEIAKKILDKYKSFTLLAGNGRHNWLNGHSVIQYLSSLGVECVGMELKRDIDGLNCFFGHYMTNESCKEYGSHDYTVSDLKQYDLVLLGHQHLCQDITPEIFHLGSVFYQSFAEVGDSHKRIAIIENRKWRFIPLRSPIPMIDVTDPAKFSDINPRTKVRLLISDFETFKKQVNGLSRWKEKFVEFKYELRYQKTSAQAHQSTESGRQKQLSIIDEINKQVKQREVRELLIAQFKDT